MSPKTPNTPNFRTHRFIIDLLVVGSAEKRPRQNATRVSSRPRMSFVKARRPSRIANGRKAAIGPGEKIALEGIGAERHHAITFGGCFNPLGDQLDTEILGQTGDCRDHLSLD